MVLMRTLLSAPTLTLSPTRQLLSHWRSPTLRHYCTSRSTFWVPALRNESRCLVDGSSGSHKESRLETLQVFKNWRFDRGTEKFPRKRSGWGCAVRTGVRYLSALSSNKEVSFRFLVTLEENSTLDSDAQAAADQLQIDGPLALKLVAEEFGHLESTDTVELSLLICNDVFIQDLNSKWLGKDSPTDVLSFPQDQVPGLTPHLLLGDVIISVDTAARQAEERGHTLLDELRILLVHGLLHVLGYDHELGSEASQEMEETETQILSKLGWKGKGLINAALESSSEDAAKSIKVDKPARKMAPAPKPPFKILFCDMDGTLLNEKSIVTEATADALRAAVAKGVQVIIATGKTRYGAMSALRPVGLSGEGGVIAATLPGVFTQGLQVYGRGGSVIHSATLEKDIVREAFLYSLEHDIPSLGFSENRIVALFESPLTDALHTVYLEPKAEVLPSISDLIASFPVQKILFYGTPESIKYKVRPEWALKTQGRVTLVQAFDEMLEVLPPGESKGAGVRMLLDHFGVAPEEVMAIGDGENDIEMLGLVGWGVAMANGMKQTKAIANALTGSNDEDGAAQAIHRYILS